MIQNYKVFLSETEVVFKFKDLSDASEDIELSPSDIRNVLERSLPPSKIVITSSNPSKSFEKFCSLFISIEAAGGIVRNAANGQFLLIYRNGVWDLPKGKMDTGETPEVTALREVEEECGIDGLTISKSVGKTFHGYIFKGQPTLKTTYWYLMNYNGVKQPHGQKEEGITEVRWVDEAAVELLLEKSFGSIQALWKNFTRSDPDTP